MDTILISSLGTGLGVGIGWFFKQMLSKNGTNGSTKFTKQEHDEICNLKIGSIHQRLEVSEKQFDSISLKLDHLLEHLGSKSNWNGIDRRKK